MLSAEFSCSPNKRQGKRPLINNTLALYNVCPNIGPKPVGRCHMSSRDSFASEAGPGDLGTLDKLVIRLVLAANAVMDRHSNPV